MNITLQQGKLSEPLPPPTPLNPKRTFQPFVFVIKMQHVILLLSTFPHVTHPAATLGGSLSTAWCVLGLQLEEQPPAKEGSCEYIE
jgi:hypothetical protein